MVFVRSYLAAFVLPFVVNAEIQTVNGPVSGVRVTADPSLNAPIPQPVDTYLGIPFAKPPVGELRFRAPVALDANWTEPLSATSQPPKCVAASGGQEDCLYLNVFVPATASAQPRAVLMWIFGGGFSSGSISSYNATSLAASEDVIVVMANYRLGFLGFMSSPGTFAESGTTGNWGILDQRLALQWVQGNIAAFGGDASRVTIFGESAGAFSVVTHLVSAGSDGLFSGAIIQSGTTHVEMFYQTREDADKYNEWFSTTHLNCPGGLADIACLRRVPASRFVISTTERDGWSAPTWGNPIFPMFASSPVIDGVVLTATPLELVRQGRIASGIRSVVIGTTQDEGSVFTTQLVNIVRPLVQFPPVASELARSFMYILQDVDVVNTFMTEELPQYQAFYGNRAVDPLKPAFREAEFQFVSNVIRNTMFACPTVTFAEALTRLNVPVYVYNFALSFWPEATKNFPVGQFLGNLGNMTVDELGAFHSSDVPFAMKLFLNKNITLNDICLETPYAMYMAPAFTQPGDIKHDVSDKMTCFWSNVAKCGRPDCAPCGAAWPAYTSEAREFLLFEADGNYSTKSVAATGPIVVGDSFPSMEKCNWYMTLRTPFHDLRSDLDLDPRLAPGVLDLGDPNGAIAAGSAALALVLVAML